MHLILPAGGCGVTFSIPRSMSYHARVSFVFTLTCNNTIVGLATTYRWVVKPGTKTVAVTVAIMNRTIHFIHIKSMGMFTKSM